MFLDFFSPPAANRTIVQVFGDLGDSEERVDALRGMLRPYDEALMRSYPVSSVVNSVKNDTEECIAELAAHSA